MNDSRDIDLNENDTSFTIDDNNENDNGSVDKVVSSIGDKPFNSCANVTYNESVDHVQPEKSMILKENETQANKKCC